MDARTIGAPSASYLKVSLCIRHPSLDPRLASAALAMQPWFSHKVGDPRRTPRGTLVGGSYDNSAWIARLAGEDEPATTATLRATLLGLADRLAPARTFLRGIKSGGGSAELRVAVFFGVLTPLAFGGDLLGRIGDLGLSLMLDLYGGEGRDEGAG